MRNLMQDEEFARKQSKQDLGCKSPNVGIMHAGCKGPALGWIFPCQAHATELRAASKGKGNKINQRSWAQILLILESFISTCGGLNLKGEFFFF